MIVIRLTGKQKPHVYMFTLRYCTCLPLRARRAFRAYMIQLKPVVVQCIPHGFCLAAAVCARISEPMDVVGDTGSKVRRRAVQLMKEQVRSGLTPFRTRLRVLGCRNKWPTVRYKSTPAKSIPLTPEKRRSMQKKREPDVHVRVRGQGNKAIACAHPSV
jgi:hypothetical protein